MSKENVIVGLDIGTTKVCVLVGVHSSQGVDIIGIGTAPSRGIRRGMVINIESTVESIKKAVAEAELMAGCEIKSAIVGISGVHIQGLNSSGVVALKAGEVSDEDIARVIDAARALAIPNDKQVLHVLPQEFILDGQDGIKDPRGMSGIRLEVKAHIVIGSITATKNLIKCVHKAGLEVQDLVLQQLASSEAILTPEEMELGVALVDIGGGTTDLAVFHRGSLRHTAILPVAGDHITSDIAFGLRTPLEEAEKIKRKYGCALASLLSSEETFEVSPVSEGQRSRVVSRRLLAEIIEPRVEEIFRLVNEELDKSGYLKLMPAGIVLTGGTALMEGIVEMATDLFDLPARRGYPRGVGGLVDIVQNPQYATAVGLVIYGARKEQPKGLKVREGGPRLKRRLKELFREMFSS